MPSNQHNSIMAEATVSTAWHHFDLKCVVLYTTAATAGATMMLPLSAL